MKDIIIYNRLGHKFTNGKVLALTEKDVDQINERNLKEFRRLFDIGEGFGTLGYILYAEVKTQAGTIKAWKLYQGIGRYDNSPEVALAYTCQALINAGYKGKVVSDYLRNSYKQEEWGDKNEEAEDWKPDNILEYVTNGLVGNYTSLIAEHEAYS